MMNPQRIFSICQSILFLIIIIFACIYSIPIICIRRFHQHNHILTLNVCLATIFCSLSYLPLYAAFMFDTPYDFIRKALTFLDIVQTIFTLQVPLSFVIASIHRYCSIVYHTKIFFKRKRWIILCIGSQWMLGFILSIPILIRIFTSTRSSMSFNVYSFASVVVVPSIICLIANMLIYSYVRSSSRRVQPQVFSGSVQRTKISRRDIYLLRHMVLMFCIFVGGWAPVFIMPIIDSYIRVHFIVGGCLSVWCEVALVIDMIDLFLYNHELRKYLKNLCLRCFIHQ